MKEITNAEIIETREILERFFEQAELHDLVRLRNNTIVVLQELRLSILNRMDFVSLTQMARSIRTVVNNFLRKTKKGFNRYSRCLSCKTIIRILLYSFSASVGIAIYAINNQFNGTVDLLSKFFEKSTESISNFLTRLGFIICPFRKIMRGIRLVLKKTHTANSYNGFGQ
jgi:hypothetical protein